MSAQMTEIENKMLAIMGDNLTTGDVLNVVRDYLTHGEVEFAKGFLNTGETTNDAFYSKLRARLQARRIGVTVMTRIEDDPHGVMARLAYADAVVKRMQAEAEFLVNGGAAMLLGSAVEAEHAAYKELVRRVRFGKLID